MRFQYLISLILLLVILFIETRESSGQSQVRKYATRQKDFTTALLNSVTNGNLAVDGSLSTHSNLNILVSTLNAGPEQVLDFHPTPGSSNEYSTMIPGNKPISVKFTTPAGLLALGLTYEIQAIKRLRDRGFLSGWTYENVGQAFSGDLTALSLLGGAGDNEITITPNADYQGVRVKIFSPVLGAAASAGVYHAYILENGTALNCAENNAPIDVLSGTRSGALNALTSLGGVNNPYNAINGNSNDFATMNVGVGALNTIYLNTIFPTPSLAGQRIRIILDDPGGLLNLGLLSSFTIQPMLRGTNAGLPLATNNPLLNLRLLPGTTKYELAYTINEIFDRIELRFDNTVAALTSLKVFEVSRAPAIMLIEDPILLGQALKGCGQIDLTNAIANYQPDHYTYKFYTVSTGGTALSSSMVTSSGKYYVEAIDPVTNCASSRMEVTAVINPIPTINLSTVQVICKETNIANLNYSNVTNGGNQYKITWDLVTTGLSNIPYTTLPGTGTILISGLASVSNGTYAGKLKVINTSTGCESMDYPISLNIINAPGRAQITLNSIIN